MERREKAFSNAKYLIPNALTLSRPFLTRRAIKEYQRGNTPKAIKLFAVAVATDADGTVARALNATSHFGKLADPIVDRIMLLQAWFTLKVDPKARKVVFATEGIMVAGALALLAQAKNQEEEPDVRLMGKIRFVTHGLAGLRLMKKPEDKLASWAMASSSVLALIDYSADFIKRSRKQPV